MQTKFYQSLAVLSLAVLVLAGCGAQETAVDADIAREVDSIPAVDNHAHPVRFVAQGEPADRGFDALPVDNMEPSSDPVNLRPDSRVLGEAWQALYSAGAGSAQRKSSVIQQKGAQYPTWVLDQMGVEVMLANRVEMGPSIQPPRFRWVPYADALMYPLDNSGISSRTPDKKLFFPLEESLRGKYYEAAGVHAAPATLADYLAHVVTPTLERQRQGGAIAEKFEAAYLRSLSFDPVDRAAADRVYAQYAAKGVPSDADYKLLQDFLFRYIAAECGRLGMAVHIHTMAGAGSYFSVAGANPLNLESVLEDPSLRKTKFVMIHGGWPFNAEITPLLERPNAYLDFSAQSLLLSPVTLSDGIRQWLEHVPEKVMFGTDAYPFSDQLGWEESGWIAARTGRRALARALTAMFHDGQITRQRASQLAHMVLHDNAKALYVL